MSLLLLIVLAACGAAGAEVTENFELAYPNTDEVSITLELNEGQLQVSSSGSGVTGSVTTNVGRWQPQIDSAGDSIRVRQGEISAEVIPNAVNRWNIQLGAGTALRLDVQSSAANVQLDLGGLPLAQLNGESTTGAYTLTYTSPNPLEAGGTATFMLDTGDFTASGLLNSRLRELSVTGTSSNQFLTFDGDALAHDMDVNLETTVGTARITAQDGVPMQIVFRSLSGRIEADPQFTRIDENTWQIGDYGSVEPRVTVAVRTSAGNLNLAVD